MPFWQRISQIPNPSLALQASMARAVSFSNGVSASGSGTDLELRQSVAGLNALIGSRLVGLLSPASSSVGGLAAQSLHFGGEVVKQRSGSPDIQV